MSVDALSLYEPKEGGLYLKLKSGEPVTLRVLTLDPVASKDKWGNTRYAFVVWNWNENRAQILQKGGSVLKQLVEIHRDDSFDALNKIDIKVTVTGEGLETRYSILPLPKARQLTAEMVEEAKQINLDDKIEYGIRLSASNSGEPIPSNPDAEEGPGYAKAKSVAESIKNRTKTPAEVADEVWPSDSDAPADMPDDFLL